MGGIADAPVNGDWYYARQQWHMGNNISRSLVSIRELLSILISIGGNGGTFPYNWHVGMGFNNEPNNAN